MICFILEADGYLVYVILRDAQLKEFWRNYKTLFTTKQSKLYMNA